MLGIAGYFTAEFYVENVRLPFKELHKDGYVDIRSFLTWNDAENLIHTFISNRLDYCNILFICLPKYLWQALAYSKLCFYKGDSEKTQGACLASSDQAH